MPIISSVLFPSAETKKSIVRWIEPKMIDAPFHVRDRIAPVKTSGLALGGVEVFWPQTCMANAAISTGTRPIPHSLLIPLPIPGNYTLVSVVVSVGF